MAPETHSDPPHTCEHEGCEADALPCYLDVDLLSEPPVVSQWLCCEHAALCGYCPGCGRFFGSGTLSYYGLTMCDDCHAETSEEWDEWEEESYYFDEEE